MGWGYWPVEPIAQIREIRRELDEGVPESSRITLLAENALKAASDLKDHFDEAQEVLSLLKEIQPIEDKPFHLKIWGASRALFEKELKAWQANPAIKGRKDWAVQKMLHASFSARDKPEDSDSKNLFLADAQLTELPSLTSLHCLRNLDLRGNALTTVPPFLQNMPLESLDIGENPIHWTEEEFAKLPSSLCELSLKEADLDNLPEEEINRLDKLRWLELSGNPRLGALPESLANRPKLKIIRD